MNKRVNSCTKPNHATTDLRFKIWRNIKLIPLLALSGITISATINSHPLPLNTPNTYLQLLMHQLKPIKNSFAADTDTIVYKGVPILCSGSSLLLSAENAPSNASFKWFKNGNSAPIATTSTYNVSTPGTYSVTTEYNGVTNNYPSLTITQDATPVAQFQYTTTSDCPSSTVNFTNLSTGNDLTYNWNFGDPNTGKDVRTSNLANPSHVFVGTTGNGSQTFTVTLVVKTKGGCTSTVTHTITLNQSPDTKLGGTGSTIFNGKSYFASCTNMPSIFTFTNISSTDNTSYSIYWGDATGTTYLDNFTTISHTYRVGNYTMRYTVNGKNGCSFTKKYYVFVGKSPTAGVSDSPVFTCTGAPLVIQTNSIDNNSAGTIYTVNFSDGISNYYTASTPDTIMHTFVSNSVNKTSKKQNIQFANSFSATLIAANPCGSDTAIVAPIYVSDIPKASANVSLNAVCAGTPITCTNTNTSATYIDNTGNAHPDNFIWTVSPNTGYTVAPTSLGQTNGKSNPSEWSAGAQSFNITFTAAGNYTLKLITGNDACGKDTATQSICMSPSPVAAFSLSNTSGCAPFSVSTINQSNQPLCGTNSYQWTVNYSNNDCGNYSGNYSYQSGDNTSINPQFNFIDPGVYTINLINTYGDSQCSSVVFSKQVTVKESPVVAISSSDIGVINKKIQPTGLLKNCNSLVNPTFLWSFPGAEPSSSTSFEPDSIVYKHTGNYIISFSVTNECGTVTVNQNISISDNVSLLNAFIPNCFTPNGDGINDTWNINNIDQTHLLFLQIFNRYGALISQLKGNPITWDGKYNGEKLPAGVYYYILSIYNDNLHKEKRSGSLTILY